jgi:Zn finger protein HypA/HybF involved in hydrogenase expression
MLVCQDCGETYILERNQLEGCPACESLHVRVIAGKEFRLESIEIENHGTS